MSHINPHVSIHHLLLVYTIPARLPEKSSVVVIFSYYSIIALIMSEGDDKPVLRINMGEDSPRNGHQSISF